MDAGKSKNNQPNADQSRSMLTRMYEGFAKRKYSGSNINALLSFETPDAPKKQNPVFLGPDATLYNVDYLPLPNEKTDLLISERKQKNEPLDNSTLRNSNDFLKKSFPDPSRYESYFEYEHALIEWKIEMESSIGHIQLPTPIGKHYFRPKVSLEPLRRTESSVSSDSLDDDKESVLDDESRSTSDTLNNLTNEIHFEEESNINIENKEKEGKTKSLRIPNNYEKQRVISSEVSEDDFQEPEEISQLDTDPWESILIPVEPNPNLYSTYEDFEKAMLRWARICTELNFQPPHATQMQNLIPNLVPLIDIPRKSLNKDISSQNIGVSGSDITSTCKVGMFVPHHSQTPLFETIGIYLIEIPMSRIVPYHSEKDSIILPSLSLSVSLKDSIASLFVKILSKRMQNFDKYKQYKSPILPKLHGISTPQVKNMRLLKGMKALRRSDLSESELEGCLDCPPSVDGQNIEAIHAYVPDFGTFRIQALNKKKYRESLKEELRKDQFSFKFQTWNSWYYPLISEQTHKKSIHDLKEKIKKNYGNIKLEFIHDILQSDLLLDKFQDLLSDQLKDTLPITSVLQETISTVTYHQFLSLFRNSKNALTHAKVSFLFFYFSKGKLSVLTSEYLQSGKSKLVIEHLLNTFDLSSLYLTAYAMNMLTEDPEIFPFSQITFDLLKKILGKTNAVNSVIEIITAHYYLELIYKPMEKDNFVYLVSQPFIASQIQMLQTKIVKGLQATPQTINFLFKCLRHRNASLSSLSLFIVMQLLKSSQPDILQYLQHKETDLLGNIRSLSFSKNRHSQFAAKFLFEFLQTEWREHILTYFDESSLIEDITDPPNSGPQNTSFMCNLVTSLCLTYLSEVNMLNATQSSLLLKESLFRKLLSNFQKYLRISLPVAEKISCILAAQSKAFFKLNLIKANEDIRKSSKKTKELTDYSEISLPFVKISPSDLTEILNLLGIIDDRSHTTKSEILSCLRYLLRNQDTFEFFKKETNFYSKLVSFCRENKSLEVNKNSWKTFFEVIKYHPGIVDELVKNQKLGQFLDIVTTGGGHFIIMNALRYIAKLFQLPSKENKESTKDIKSLISFFIQRHHFIRIHMIYRHMVKDGVIISCGAAFQELVNFYYVIANEQICAKLFKDAIKNAEFKEGFIHLLNMVTPGRFFDSK